MGNRRNRNRRLIPQANDALNQLKVQVAQDLGINVATPQQLQQTIDLAKFEIAADLGVPLQQGYNGDITSRDAGAIGGRLGGHLGGQMVRRMIAQAELQLANQQR